MVALESIMFQFLIGTIQTFEPTPDMVSASLFQFLIGTIQTDRYSECYTTQD